MGDYQQKGEGHNIPPREVLERLSADISRRWLGQTLCLFIGGRTCFYLE
jgi:hypothetical protein